MTELLLKGYANRAAQDRAERLLKQVAPVIGDAFRSFISTSQAAEYRRLAREATDSDLRKAYQALADQGEYDNDDD